jgi:hypothetical protein
MPDVETTASTPINQTKTEPTKRASVAPTVARPGTLQVETIPHLPAAARAAGAAMIELLLRCNDERWRGVHLSEGSSLMSMCDALVTLHKAIVWYEYILQRQDGRDVARAGIELESGEGIADLVMISLAEITDILTTPASAAVARPSENFINNLYAAKFG